MINYKKTVSLATAWTEKLLYRKDFLAFNYGTLQLAWSSVAGTKDGVITIYGSNDPEGDAWTLLDTVNVDSASNLSDVYALIIDASFKCLKIDYDDNSITGGSLDIIAELGVVYE